MRNAVSNKWRIARGKISGKSAKDSYPITKREGGMDLRNISGLVRDSILGFSTLDRDSHSHAASSCPGRFGLHLENSTKDCEASGMSAKHDIIRNYIVATRTLGAWV